MRERMFIAWSRCLLYQYYYGPTLGAYNTSPTSTLQKSVEKTRIRMLYGAHLLCESRITVKISHTQIYCAWFSMFVLEKRQVKFLLTYLRSWRPTADGIPLNAVAPGLDMSEYGGNYYRLVSVRQGD